MRDADEIGLPQAERDAFDLVVAHQLAAVRRTLERDPPTYLSYAVCLEFVQAPPWDVPGIRVGREQDRQALRRELGEFAAFQAVWDPERYYEERWISPRPSAAPEFEDAEALLAAVLDDVLQDAGIDEDPPRWVLSHVARELTVRPPLRYPTGDFLAYCFAYDSIEDQLELLRFAAAPTAARALREKRLLPDRLEDLEGVPW